MLSSLEIKSTLIELKPILSKTFHVEKIGVFGSFAREEQRDESDIDILVHFSEPIGWEIFDLQDLLEQKLNRKIDLVSDKALKPQLRQSILQQVIYA